MRKEQTSQPEYSNMPPVFPTELAMHYTMHIFVMAKLLELRPKTILDVGCGKGTVLASLKRNRRQVKYVGIDIANMAKCIEPKGGIFYQRDICAHFDLGKFNAIVFSEVLEHLTRNEGVRVLKRIYKMLGRNGHCVLTTPLWTSTENAEYQRTKHFHVHLWKYAELIQVLRAIGFKIKEHWPARMIGSKQRIGTLTKHFIKHYDVKSRYIDVMMAPFDDIVARFGGLVAQSIFQHVIPFDEASHIQMVLQK